MKKENLKNLSRKELVDVVYNMMNEQDPSRKRLDPKEVTEERKRLRKRARIRRATFTAVGLLAVVAAVAVLLSTYLLPVIQVSGNSMEPTLSDGDVLVLLHAGDYRTGQLCCVAWQNKLLIKRVIAISGDSVDIDEKGNVYINGELIDEPYVSEKSLGECDIDFPYTVPEGRFFVMGDQRDTSIDSRSSVIGCVEKDQIVGKVLGKVWPLG
jgi:signal peptidase I